MMKTTLVLVSLLYLGTICLSDDTSESSETSETSESSQSSQESTQTQDGFHEAHEQMMDSLFKLAHHFNNSVTVDQNDTTSNTTDNFTVDQKCFFWPWFGWLLGCKERICFRLGAFADIEVCGYDTNLGYKTFKNSCYLNATNTCYSTNYTLNHTGVCT